MLGAAQVVGDHGGELLDGPPIAKQLLNPGKSRSFLPRIALRAVHDIQELTHVVMVFLKPLGESRCPFGIQAGLGMVPLGSPVGENELDLRCAGGAVDVLCGSKGSKFCDHHVPGRAILRDDKI